VLSCRACGVPALADARFCAACGAPLGAEPAADARRIGQYAVLREIARGGMGVVYEALDERLGRRVALKVLLVEFSQEPEFRERFIRESHAAAALDHPNILPVFDAGEVDGVLYIASRLVDGVDLRGVLDRDGTLPVDRALAIVGQVAAALDYAHDRDIVHRDVKPANVLLVSSDADRADHAYLIDFGITTTKSADMRLTASGGFVGTPEYVAPEQLKGDAVDGRADQYALACVLYHCLVGSSPFAGSTTVDVLHAHLHDEPPHPTASAPTVALAVGDAIVRALSKDPSQRFESCRAFVSAARRGIGEPASQQTMIESRRPVAPAADEEEPKSRRATALIVGLAVAVVAVAGVLVALLLGGSDGGGGKHAIASATAPPSTTAPAVVTQPTSTAPTTTQPPTTTTPARKLIDLGAVARPTRRLKLKGYSAELPAWHIDHRDRVESPTRRQTVVTDATSGASVLIDALVDFEETAKQNLGDVEAEHAKNPGYRSIGEHRYDVGGSPAYETRYRDDSDGDGEGRNVDVMFKHGTRLFAVLTSGYASYDDLSALALQTARSITVNAPPRKKKPAPSFAPERGTYSGPSVEYDDTGAILDEDSVTMTFGRGEATIRYPGLACRGTLSYVSPDGKRRLYAEHIERGDEQSCPRGGFWTIERLSGSKLRANWSRPHSARRTKAILKR
jgi:hypothetical protein